MNKDRNKIGKVVSFLKCKGRRDVEDIVRYHLYEGVVVKCRNHQLMSTLRGEGGGKCWLSDKQFLLFMGIGMNCRYRNMSYYNRDQVMAFSGVGRSAYWSNYKVLVEYGLVVDSGLTFTDRKDNMVFVSPDYFYCGYESRRISDLNRWGLGNKVFGI